MKKVFLFIFLVFFAATIVDAKIIYSDFELKGVIDKFNDDSDTVKYIPIKYNRFYKIDKISEVYALDEIELDGYPYRDYDDYISEYSYSLENSNSIRYSYVNGIDATINSITFRDFTSLNNNISEIEIYDNDQLVKYSLNNYNWLNDGIYDNYNYSIAGKLNFILDNSYEVKNLSIKIYYTDNNVSSSEFWIGYKNINNNIFTERKVKLEYNSDVSIDLIKIMDADSYNNYLKEINLYDECYSKNSKQCSMYLVEKRWIKHYQLGKVYYLDSPLENIDGYMYDNNESYNLYLIFERQKNEVIEEDNEIIKQDSEIKKDSGNDIPIGNGEIKQELESFEQADKNSVFHEDISIEDEHKDIGYLNSYPSYNNENIDYTSTAIEVEKDLKKSEDNNNKYIAYTYNSDANIKQEGESSVMHNQNILIVFFIVFILFTIIFIIYNFTDTIHYACQKICKKNR